MISRVNPSFQSRAADPEQHGTLPPVPGTDWGIVKVTPKGIPDLLNKTFPVPGGGGPLTDKTGTLLNLSGCEFYCSNCGLGLPGMNSSITMCVECIRCYLVRGLKTIGVDLLLGLLLLLGIYLLFQKQINVTVTKTAKTAAEAAAA